MEEEKKKASRGRPKLPPKEKRSKYVMLSFSETEYEKLQREMEESGYKEAAVYVRRKLLARQEQLIYSPREALDALNVLGREVGAIGKNINQIARYVNYLKANNMVKPHVLEEYNTLLRKLTEIELSMQKTIRGFFRE